MNPTAERRLPGRRSLAPEDWRPTGIDELEPSAWDALRDRGCTAVVAGPGAGKTEFLAQRAAFLLQTGLCPARRRILAISYKRDSAANLARRVADRVPEHAGRFVSLTFDSFTKGLVDRFRSALPGPWAMNGTYEVTFWKDREQEYFRDRLALAVSGQLRLDLFRLPGSKFLTEVVGGWALPEQPPDTASAADLAALSWWREHYLRPGTQYVDFVMLNRLAELLVRTRPQLRRALRITYPYVFVDEFQDTTLAQLSFLGTAFGSAVITAVGDRKQRIMGFAGALPDAFGRYKASFGATGIPADLQLPLLRQPRAAATHVIASSLEPEVTRTVSKAPPKDQPRHPLSCGPSTAPPAKRSYVAESITRDIARSGRQPAELRCRRTPESRRLRAVPAAAALATTASACATMTPSSGDCGLGEPPQSTRRPGWSSAY